jgi:hypothetical protein
MLRVNFSKAAVKLLSRPTAQRAVAIAVLSAAPGVWLLGIALDPPAVPHAEAAPVAGERLIEAAKAPARAAVKAALANPLLDPDAMMVPARLLSAPLTDEEKASMAAELDRLQTRHASELVRVIASVTQAAPSPVPPSFLLSIAFAETRGKVLAVSPAGAAGLAQATPAAILMEGVEGPLYVTTDYLVGTRAYIMKKPLGDAVGIAERVIEGEATHAEALELLGRAQDLRRVGVDELEALAPRAPEVFLPRVEAADRYNVQVLDRLGRLLEARASKKALEGFRDEVRKEYRTLLRVQQANWKRYGESLERERDGVLERHFGIKASRVLVERPYEAGEILGERLDARFSPTRMAEFLSRHVQTKRQQALDLGIPEDEIEAWTAALYNGGLVNVSRMRAGLMSSIRETENYMEKVPAMRQQLDGVTALAAP